MRSAVMAIAMFAPIVAQAALPDEIQVYTDDINRPGETGLELHVNTTPSGLTQPGYPGEVLTAHGMRITPELSYGITKSLEAGLYLPVSLNNGNSTLAGYKLRLKWLPLRGEDGGVFAGANIELGDLRPQFAAARRNAELRTIIGHRSDKWLFAVNPIFAWTLSASQEQPAPGNPEFTINYKASRDIGHDIALGLEYYNPKGTWRQFDPGPLQSKTLFATVEIDRGPLPLHFGIGRGLNGASDRWTLKMILEYPLN